MESSPFRPGRFHLIGSSFTIGSRASVPSRGKLLLKIIPFSSVSGVRITDQSWATVPAGGLPPLDAFRHHN
jgi:hypothetical protein